MRALDYDVVEKLGDDARKLKAEIGVLQMCIDELRDCHRRGKARQRVETSGQVHRRIHGLAL